MSNELNPQKKELIRKLLKGYQGFKIGRRELKISETKQESFMSEIDTIARTKKPFELPGPKERPVFARPVPALAGALVAALVAVLVYSYAFAPQAPVLHGIKGTVKIFDASRKEWAFAEESRRITVNDIVKTFGDGNADISLEDLYSMRLKSGSEIKVARLNSRMRKRAIRFEIKKGKVLAYYNRRAGEEKGQFELETEAALVTAVGTDFMLEAIPKLRKTWLGVLDGVIKVTSLRLPEGIIPGEATVLVRPRHKTEVFEGMAPNRPERMMEEEWFDMRELYSIGKKPQVALLISSGPTRTRELLSLVPLYVSDKVSSALSEKFEKAARAYEKALQEESREKHSDAVRQFEDIVKEHPNPDYDVPFLLFIGAYHEYLENHDEAVRIFRKIITEYPESSLSSMAQCAIGIIYEGLKDREMAIEAYRKVISRYPESPESEEARSGLTRLSR
jgi:tetratricopeptide (TPR) repeat protein